MKIAVNKSPGQVKRMSLSSRRVSLCEIATSPRVGERFFLLYLVGQIKAPRFHSYRKPKERIAKKASIR